MKIHINLYINKEKYAPYTKDNINDNMYYFLINKMELCVVHELTANINLFYKKNNKMI